MFRGGGDWGMMALTGNVRRQPRPLRSRGTSPGGNSKRGDWTPSKASVPESDTIGRGPHVLRPIHLEG